MIQAIVWVLLAPALAVSPLNHDAPPDPKAAAQALAADVLCGEAGWDETLSGLVANVIINRMDRRGGTRVEKIHAILEAPRQFNGRCSRRGEVPSGWHRLLAKILVDGDLNQIRRTRPRWFTDKVLEFTETAGECAFAAKPKSGKVKGKKGKKPKVQKCSRWRHGRVLVHRYIGPRPRHGQAPRMSFFANP